MGTQVIDILVNGNPRRVGSGTTVAQLLVQLDAAGKRVAVERNGEIVPKSRHADMELADSDRLEVVIAVGGG